MADQQPRGTIPKRLEDCFSNFSYTLARGYEIRERQRRNKSGRLIVIDFQTITIHTGWYVGGTQEPKTQGTEAA